MKTSNRISRLVDDLAAHWTEPVLEILYAAGKAQVSVQSEIEAWHSLRAALQTELQGPRTIRLAATASFSAVWEQVFGQALSVLASKYNLLLTSRELDERIHELIRERRATPAEHELFGELVSEPAARVAFKSPRQTDFVPRLQLAAVGG